MSDVIALLETYKYFLLFPLAVVEGPLLTVVGGFLVSIGIMDAFIVLPVVVLSDVVGDTTQYVLGRFGSGLIDRYGYVIGITNDRLKRTRDYFQKHHLKSIAQSKLMHGIGFIGIIAAGSLKIPYGRFALTALTISLLQSTVLLFIGIFFGYAYVQIGQYLSYFAATASVSAVLVAGTLVFLYFKRKSRDL